jgi:hypothetical protein
MATIYRPGNIVQTSGVYGVVNRLGTLLGREASCSRGDRFPATRHGTAEYGWVLKRPAHHLR